MEKKGQGKRSKSLEFGKLKHGSSTCDSTEAGTAFWTFFRIDHHPQIVFIVSFDDLFTYGTSVLPEADYRKQSASYKLGRAEGDPAFSG
jgi:hypothetical protein